MATPQTIDLSNYSTLLKLSTQSRSGTPDGNFFINHATSPPEVEFITLEDLPTVDLGSGPEANPLTDELGIKLEAAYAFERLTRQTNEVERQYDYAFDANFKFAGAYDLVNGYKFAGSDRAKIRGSGWRELDASGAIGRIYYGNVSLANIEAASQPYYQLTDGGVPVDYQKVGPINEAVQVFGDAAVDSTTTTFDTRTFEALKVRTFGFNYDEKQLADSGVAEMGPYSTGFALGETPHLTTGNYTLADVYGGAQIAPWTGMTLEELDTPQTETGFSEVDGDFTWILHNTDTPKATLDEAVAYLDAIAQTDDDINIHVTNVTNGKRVGTWYTYDANGRILTRSGADGNGLYIENIPVADEQKVVFTADDGSTKTRPFNVSVQVAVGSNAVADANAWYHAFFLAAFNSASAVAVQDNTATEVKGSVTVDPIQFGFDFDGDTLGGAAGTNKDVVFECEGNGGVTAAKTVFTLLRQTVVSASCVPPVETNL